MAGLNAFASNIEAEETGLWIDVEEMSFLVARTGNDNWKAELKKLERQTFGTRSKKKDKQADEKMMQILLKCLAKTCVLDWKNVTLDGKPLPYSVAKSVEILTDKRFKGLAALLLDYAMDEERYLEEEIQKDEEVAKN